MWRRGLHGDPEAVVTPALSLRGHAFHRELLVNPGPAAHGGARGLRRPEHGDKGHAVQSPEKLGLLPLASQRAAPAGRAARPRAAPSCAPHLDSRAGLPRLRGSQLSSGLKCWWAQSFAPQTGAPRPAAQLPVRPASRQMSRAAGGTRRLQSPRWPPGRVHWTTLTRAGCSQRASPKASPRTCGHPRACGCSRHGTRTAPRRAAQAAEVTHARLPAPPALRGALSLYRSSCLNDENRGF